MLGGFVDRGQSVRLLEYFAEGSGIDAAEFVLFGKDRDSIKAKDAVEESIHQVEIGVVLRGSQEVQW